MGLDCYIEKRPAMEKQEVKYWRKNWVLQNYMESENCVDKQIDDVFMENLLAETIKMEEESFEGSEGWTEDDWDAFRDDIRDVISDMQANETYEYTYQGWW